MMLEEANKRLKSPITDDELWQLNPAYIMLDLDKDDFCKIVNTVGKDKIIGKQSWYERLIHAEEELKAKEKYLAAQQRLLELKEEEQNLKLTVEAYQTAQRILDIQGGAV